jgi:hypothetical protein
MAIQAGPLLAGFFEIERGVVPAAGDLSWVPLALSLAGFLLAYLLFFLRGR